MARSSTTSVSTEPPVPPSLLAVLMWAISPPGSRSLPLASWTRRPSRAVMPGRRRSGPATFSSRRVKPTPTVTPRSVTVIPLSLARQPKSRRPVIGPSSLKLGALTARVLAGGVAMVDGVERVSRPTANAPATVARISTTTAPVRVAGSNARRRLAARPRSEAPGWPGWGGRASSPASPQTGQAVPGRAARSSSHRGHHASLRPAIGLRRDDPETAGGLVEAAAALVGAGHDVLDPRPEAAGQVDAGLDRERHARLQRLPVAGHDIGVLMLVQADAVAGPVDEVLAVARGGDHVAAGGVDRLGGDAGPDRGAAGELGGVQHRVRLLEAGRRFADDQRAGGVGAIAVQPAADVDHHRVARLDDSPGGDVVGAGGVRAGADDREARLVVAAADGRLDLAGQLQLGPAGPAQPVEAVDDPVEGGRHPGERLDLLGVLAHAGLPGGAAGRCSRAGRRPRAGRRWRRPRPGRRGPARRGPRSPARRSPPGRGRRGGRGPAAPPARGRPAARRRRPAAPAGSSAPAAAPGSRSGSGGRRRARAAARPCRARRAPCAPAPAARCARRWSSWLRSYAQTLTRRTPSRTSTVTGVPPAARQPSSARVTGSAVSTDTRRDWYSRMVGCGTWSP